MTEHQVPYPADIVVPYEVTETEERTIWEIEEYIIDKKMPVVTETPKIVTEYDKEVYNVPVKDVVHHSHPVHHDHIHEEYDEYSHDHGHEEYDEYAILTDENFWVI